MASSLSWDVQLPERKESNSFARKPRATVVLQSEEGGQESFSVPLAVGKALDAAKEGISVGSRAEMLFRIREMSESCGWDRFLRMLSHRDYAASEVEDKLYQDGYSKQVAQAIVQRARDANLLDDIRFADIFIRSKVLSGWGSGRIVRELRNKGIEASSVPGWPDEYLVEDEYDRAYSLALTRRESVRLSYEKLARYLSSRGFSASVCSRVASRVVHETEEEL